MKRKSIYPVPVQRRSKKLARVLDELLENCEQVSRPYYLNRTPLTAMHNANKKTLRLPLFDSLDNDIKQQYVDITSNKDGENSVPNEYYGHPESFYNDKGDRISLTPRQEFLIMVLMEVCNEQCMNVYRSEEPDFMKNYWTNVAGDVVITPYKLATKLYGTNNPAGYCNIIKEELEFLATSSESMVLLAYKEKVEEGEYKTRVVYNHLIEIVPAAQCFDGKTRYVIRLHQGIFFTRLKRNYILLHSGITSKLTRCYGSFPPRHTLNLLEFLLVAGNIKKESGYRSCQISADKLKYLLNSEAALKRRLFRSNYYFHDAVNALVNCGILKDTGLAEMDFVAGQAARKQIITFVICDGFFREKTENITPSENEEDAFILTYDR